jgi:hypothetical protein
VEPLKEPPLSHPSLNKYLLIDLELTKLTLTLFSKLDHFIIANYYLLSSRIFAPLATLQLTRRTDFNPTHPSLFMTTWS